MIGDAEAAGRTVRVTDVAAGYTGDVPVAGLLTLLADAYASRRRSIAWE